MEVFICSQLCHRKGPCLEYKLSAKSGNGGRTPKPSPQDAWTYISVFVCFFGGGGELNSCKKHLVASLHCGNSTEFVFFKGVFLHLVFINPNSITVLRFELKSENFWKEVP